MNKQKFAAVLCICFCLLTGCSDNKKTEGDYVNEYIPEFSISREKPAEKPSADNDFYGYVNFDTLSGLEIGYDRTSAGPMSDRSAEVERQIKNIIEEIVESSEDYPEGSPGKNIRDLYFQYRNFKGADPETVKVFEDVYQMIENAETVDEYMIVCADILKKYGVKTFVTPETVMNPFEPETYCVSVCGIENYTGYSISFIPETSGAAASVRELSERFIRCTSSNKDYEQRSDNVAELIISVANATDKDASDTRLRASKAEYKTAAEMEKMFSSFSFSGYIRHFSGVYPDGYCIYDKKQLEYINSVLVPENLRALKDIAYAAFVSEYKETAPDDFASFTSFLGVYMRYDEKSAYNFIEMNQSGSIEILYAGKYTDDNTIKAAEGFCEDIRKAYRNTINASSWISREAADRMVKKLDNITFLIGVPEKTEINKTGKNLFETMVNNKCSRLHTDLTQAGQKYDNSYFKIDATDVNACYDHDNTVTVPAAFLAAPFFSPDADDIDNLSKMGFIVAHEISHAFDSYGICYDYNNKYDPEWIPEKDLQIFEEKKEKTVKYYSSRTIMDVHHVNGKDTLSENLADLGAVECILDLADNDSDRKRILENYASLFCMMQTEHDAVFRLHNDTHSPNVTRVNAVVSSCDDFYRLYDVKEGSGMYIAPEERTGRWLR